MQHIERERDTTPAFKRFLISLRERQAQLRYAVVNVLLVVVLALTIVRLESNRRAQLAAKTGSNVAGTPGGFKTVIRPAGLGESEWEQPTPGNPDVPAEAMRFEPTYPLKDVIDGLNEEFREARAREYSEGIAAGWSGTGDGIVPVDAPVILRPGPDGSLMIERQSEPAGQADTAPERPTEQPGDEKAGE